MRVLVTADPGLPVPPRLYGGIERVIALLVDGLVARGHEVTLVAHRDSVVDAELVAYSAETSRGPATLRHAATIAASVMKRQPDVVQSFGRLATMAPILPWPVPKVMSYQRAITRRTVQWARRLAHGTLSFTGCSAQLIRPVATLGDWHVVYNAVPTSRFDFQATVPPDAPLVFLGRIERIKGTHVAIEVARRARRRLVIAGNVPANTEAEVYFRDAIKPHLDGQAVSYVGPVDDAAKTVLLGSAAALLMPVLWDEPFGIVMAEALACGTPVIGLDRGAVPEVVAHGTTGFVAHDADGLVAAVARIPDLDRAACREAAERRFSPAALVDAYESIFSGLVGAKASPARVIA